MKKIMIILSLTAIAQAGWYEDQKKSNIPYDPSQQTNSSTSQGDRFSSSSTRVDPYTGTLLIHVGGGMIDTNTGEFYPGTTDSGYINPKNGQYYPPNF